MKDGLNDLAEARIKYRYAIVEAEVMTQPSLIKTDGVNLTYAVTVKIAGYDDILRNVPIAVASSELEYADIGAAVTLRRDAATGRYEIIGYAKHKPGTRKLVPVNVETSVVGAIEDLSFTARLLTLAELGDLSFGTGFGSIPFGASAIFQGGALLELSL